MTLPIRAPFVLRMFDTFAPWVPIIRSRLESGDWAPDCEEADTESPVLVPTPTELEDVEGGANVDVAEIYTGAGWEPPKILDMREKAATAKYKNGKLKLTRYRRRKPGTCKLVTAHQTGVERRDDSTRFYRVSAHYVITRSGWLIINFDHDVRLASSNALDRSPYQAVNIEVSGNFEGLDGSGRWWRPDLVGKGRATPAQLKTLCWLLDKIAREEPIEMVAPHRVSGRKWDKKRRKWIPNRQICPGSRVWQCAEGWAMRNGILVPDGDDTMGGLPIEEAWRTQAWLDQYGGTLAA